MSRTDTLVGVDGYSVGEVAELLGVSVRTLHHWESMGLVRADRTAGGYRRYSHDDLARIQRVVLYRELGLSLPEVASVLDADPLETLRRQRIELLEQVERTERMVAAVDRLIAATERGILLTPGEQRELFGPGWNPDLVDQAREQYGMTSQWRQFAERSTQRSPQDWGDVADETRAVEAAMVTAVRSGVVPGTAPADEIAERHRASLARYFDCTVSMQVCLGRKYLQDEGFRSHYDGLEPGLTSWLHDVIDANARAHGVDPDTAVWE